MAGTAPTLLNLAGLLNQPGSGLQGTEACKKLLCKVVNKLLADTTNSIKELEVSLEFITYTLETCPQLFVSETVLSPPRTPSLAEINTHQETEDEAECFGICSWVIRHMLCVMSASANPQEYQQGALTVIQRLLHTVLLKDAHAFGRLGAELIYSLADLVGLEDRLADPTVSHAEPYPLDRFTTLPHSPEGAQAAFTCPALPVTAQNCEAIQIALTEILVSMSAEICQFVARRMCVPGKGPASLLWASVTCQLEMGDFDLKNVSLRLLQQLLCHLGLVAPPCRDYFLQCMVALVELLLDGVQDDMGSLETALQSCLQSLLLAIHRPDISYADQTDVYHTLYSNISKSVSVHGTRSLRSDDLRVVVCDILAVLSGFPKAPLSTADNAAGNPVVSTSLSKATPNFQHGQRELATTLLAEIGTVPNTQYAVQLLKSLIMQELPLVSGKPTTNTDSSQVAPPVEESKKLRLTTRCRSPKRKASAPELLASPAVSWVDKVWLVQELRGLLQKLITKVLQPEALKNEEVRNCLLEGCRGILEVFAFVEINIAANKMQDSIAVPPVDPILLPADMCCHLVNCWVTVLSQVVPSGVAKYYPIIIKSIGAMLVMMGPQVSGLPADTVSQLVCVLSLPWLQAEVSWLDLRPHNQRDVAQHLAPLGDHIDAGCQAECVRVLCALPKDVTPQWRTQALRLALTSCHDTVRSAAVQAFPEFLYHQGANANHLITDLLHGLVSDKSVLVQHAVAKAMGPLVCVASRSVTINRQREPSAGQLSYHLTCFTCSYCDCGSPRIEKEGLSQSPDEQRDPPKGVGICLFVRFLDLLKVNNTDLQLALVWSLGRLFAHLSLAAAQSPVIRALTVTMELLNHPQYRVRVAFSTVLPRLLTESDSDSQKAVRQLVVSQLKAAAKQARQVVNTSLMETVLISTGQLARAAERELLQVLIVILYDNLCCPISALVAATAHSQLKGIGSHKNVKMRHLFVRHTKAICKVLVEQMHETQSRRRNKDPTDILQATANAFHFEDTKSLLRRCEHTVLPLLAMKASNAASFLIKLVAKILADANHKVPLARNISYIFCHLVCNCSTNEVLEKLRYLERECDWDQAQLLSQEQNVDSELLLHLSSHHHRVLTGLKILMTNIGLCEGNIEDITDEEIAEVLQPKLLGLLVYFDNYLNNGTVPVADKMRAYESVLCLMKLMGPQHVTGIRVRMMTTLKLGLKFKDRGFPELCCRAWNTFVHTVDVSAVGSMLSQIAVTLLPLLQTLPGPVTEILSYLIVDNRAHLQSYFHDLYFLPDTPELADVHAVLKQHITAENKPTLRCQLPRLLQGLCHESHDVQLLALTKLRGLLRQHQVELHTLILGSDSVDPIISQTVSTLLQGCRESAAAARSLFGECLGQLGAIDPGRLEVLTNLPKQDLSSFQSTVDDSNFTVDLINRVAMNYLRAEDRNKQDSVAYAIQELLRVYKIDNTRDNQMWNRFEEEVQEILVPFLASKYVLRVREDYNQLPRPVYRSAKGNRFDSWISTLTGYLGNKVTQQMAQRVFEACRGVVVNDSQVALYLLPQVVVHVLLEDSATDTDELVIEILAVLNHVSEANTRHGSASDLRHMSAQTVFSVLDHLTKWTRHRVLTLTNLASAGRQRAHIPPDKLKADPGLRCIHSFMDRIPPDVLAHASFNCNAYTRALMHYEQFLTQRQHSVQGQNHLDFLQKVYVALDEPDGVAGIMAIKQSPPTLNEQILAYESIGQLLYASVCYDHAIQQEVDYLPHRQGLLRCRLALGELNSALELTNGMIASRPEWGSQLNAYRVEAVWKLGQWDQLHAYLQTEDLSTNWNVGLGKVLLAAENKNVSEFRQQVSSLRSHLMGPLSAASMEVGSYLRGYEYIVRLHMLNELEEGIYTILGPTHQGASSDHAMMDFKTLVTHWDNRLQASQTSYRTQEPILNLRRIVLGLADDSTAEVTSEIGRCWLNTAQVARECGLIQTAHSSLLSAVNFSLDDFCLEHAKWLWESGDCDRAQTELEKAIKDLYPNRASWATADESQTVDRDKRLACAKAMLLLGRYCEETASWESNAIMRQYREVPKVHGEWEDAYFYIAKYYDKIMVQLLGNDRPEKRGEFLAHVIQFFGQSLMYGSQYIYQSMPRLLALWLDYGAEVVDFAVRRNDAVLQGMRAVLAQLNKHMSVFCNRLAPYQFLTAFPQLISRICHTHPDVFMQLKEIVASLLVAFPQQAMWMMMAVSKSSFSMRVRRGQDIFSRAKSINPDLNKFLQDATKLTDRLLELSNKNVETNSSNMASISQQFKPLQRLIDDPSLSPILLPLQKLMTPSLPHPNVSPSNHQPFLDNQVYIQGILDTVEIVPSMQKPKKITFRGSDGKQYHMLCKPKDDLRKDARLMEFNEIVNKCLRKDAESRRRDLHIRTYMVTPLNEECGLLEWVSNMNGIRHILLRLYRERGPIMTAKELKALGLKAKDPPAKTLEIYRTKLMPRHPPVFGEWFLRTFPDPTSWYAARLAYCRTTAVMSMVGYILGLGDRHGENLLLDSTNGDCFHVDFNCLFNKGETFEFPEVVPFRLTHNMVVAMGPLGVEGPFRRACEVTLRVMRDQMDPLMSVLRTFIYDPLVEWSKPVRGRSNPTETGESRNEKAQTHVENIETRLKGLLKTKTRARGLPLSVEGHCNHLIKEATDETNLSQMYIGWAPFM